MHRISPLLKLGIFIVLAGAVRVYGDQDIAVGRAPDQYVPLTQKTAQQALTDARGDHATPQDILYQSARLHGDRIISISDSKNNTRTSIIQAGEPKSQAGQTVSTPLTTTVETDTNCPSGFKPYDNSLGTEWQPFYSWPGYPIPNTTYCFRADRDPGINATVYTEALWDNTVPNGQGAILAASHFGPFYGLLFQYINFDDGRRQAAINYFFKDFSDVNSFLDTIKVGDTLTYNDCAPNADGTPDCKNGYQIQIRGPITPAGAPIKLGRLGDGSR